MEIVQDPTPWPPSLWIMISVDFESPILQRPLQKCLSQRSWVKMFHFWAEILTRMLLPGNQPSASKSACLLFFKTFLIRKMSQKISGVVGWRETGSFEWQSREGGRDLMMMMRLCPSFWWACNALDELGFRSVFGWCSCPRTGNVLSDWGFQIADLPTPRGVSAALFFLLISWRFLVAIMHATFNNFPSAFQAAQQVSVDWR